MKLATRVILLTGLVLLGTLSSHDTVLADWPLTGLLVRDTGGAPTGLAPDGSGGIYLNWGINAVQHVSAGGELLVTPGGPLLPGASVVLPCFSDDAGGIYIAALEGTTIRLLRVGSTGNIIWNAPVCQTTNLKNDVCASTDGAGGALVAWAEARPELPAPEDAISAYCQRINSSGTALWQADGLRVRYSYLTPPHSLPSFGVPVRVEGVTHSGANALAGGAHVYAREEDWSAWVYMVHAVDPNGTLGAGSAIGAFTPNYITSVADDFGGSYVAKLRYLNNQATIYLELHGPNGSMQWSTPVAPFFSYPEPLLIRAVSDGALVGWIDKPDLNTLEPRLYIQKLDRTGSPLWVANGVEVENDVTSFDLATDFHGGAMVVFASNRSGPSDVYVQRLNTAGASMLPSDGVPVIPVPGNRTEPKLYADPFGHAIVTWRNDSGESYASRIDVTTLAVAISDFSGRSGGNQITLSATLHSDAGVEFVKVYRAIGDDRMVLRDELAAPPSERFAYTDDQVLPATTYRYQLAVSDADGEFFSPIVTVTTPSLEFSLEQNQPNPFNPSTTIRFVVPERNRAVLSIYSADGRLVRTIMDEIATAGSHEARWDGRDAAGAPVSSGIYFYRLNAGKLAATRKMVLLK